MKKLLIFDLDGTLLNTIADLAHSTNYALEKNGFPAHHLEEYNYFVGNGINKLFERALPEGEKTEENIAKIRQDFLAHYDVHNADASRPYEGIPELLQALQDKGIQLAVATAVLGQREGVKTKPDPGIVSEIREKAHVEAADTLYIGDSNVDMQTAINSGVDACGVTWGFRPASELESYHPKYIAQKASGILDMLG